MTAYNREREVLRCVASCMDQAPEDFELVVVDDGSTDGTAMALKAVAEPRLRVIRHDRNRGISTARATAVDQATGNWLVMLDSDWSCCPARSRGCAN